MAPSSQGLEPPANQGRFKGIACRAALKPAQETADGRVNGIPEGFMWQGSYHQIRPPPWANPRSSTTLGEKSSKRPQTTTGWRMSGGRRRAWPATALRQAMWCGGPDAFSGPLRASVLCPIMIAIGH